MNFKNIILGFIIGVTISSAVVSIVGYFALQDINREFMLIKKVLDISATQDNSANEGSVVEANVYYNSQDSVKSDWKNFSSAENNFSLMYPKNWNESKVEDTLCLSGVDDTNPACSNYIFTYTNGNEVSTVNVSRHKTINSIDELFAYPLVLKIAGQDVTVYAMRKGDCVIGSDNKASCKRNDNNGVQFYQTEVSVNGSSLFVIITGNLTADAAGILSTIK